MKFQFDPKKHHQLEAVEAVTSLFQGQSKNRIILAPDRLNDPSSWSVPNCVANRFDLALPDIHENLRDVQIARGLPASETLDKLDFSIEMETGTGKTYVYLRTIEELHKANGLSKFIIVVPSLAIREGVFKTLEITQKHLDGIYDKRRREYRMYSSKRLSAINRFVSANSLQIMLMNIDSFNKKSNNINKAIGGFGGLSGLETLSKTKPIVILDEPQNLEGERAKAAIESLSPLAVLRYSATHRSHYNLIHRLTPVDAYELRLVKRIEVLSVIPEVDPGDAYIKLLSVSATKRAINAKMEINCATPTGIVKKSKTISSNSGDLFAASGGVSAYDGLFITGIDLNTETIELSNGAFVTPDKTLTDARPAMRMQIEETIREHFEKELAVARYFSDEQRPKVLSLFFIDRVSNYVPEDSFLRTTFEEAYTSLRSNSRYSELTGTKAFEVHGGYFSAVKGIAKDTSGRSRADNDTFELIMKDKERLLSLDEPIRFIFSHSALREGWDNPNVFQICTLNQSRSTIKKRQEIGRGMRLPVNQIGVQIVDPAVNFLTVIANESYSEFASSLQREIEEDCGVEFGGAIGNRRKRIAVEFKSDWRNSEDLKSLWQIISQPTTMNFDLDVSKLLSEGTKRLKNSPPIQKPKIIANKASLQIGRSGVMSKLTSQRSKTLEARAVRLPNLVYELQQHCGVSRRTIRDILCASGRLPEFLVNPDVFMTQAKSAITSALRAIMSVGVKYELSESGSPSIDCLANTSQMAYVDRCVQANKSPFNYVPYDSNVERGFLETLDVREDISVIIKLPSMFFVNTPIGNYWPDWAIVKLEGGSGKLYLVRETKSNWDKSGLRPTEALKIDCASKHFTTIDANFAVVTAADQI